MASALTIHGTSGQSIGLIPWTTPENVDGAATGDVASRNVVATTAETSAALITSVPSTVIPGTMTGLSLGIRCATVTNPPVEEAFLSIYLTNAAGTVIADWTPVTNVIATHGNKVGAATLRNGATYADIQAVILAGLTGAAGPIGLYAIARNTGASTTFEVEALWLVAAYSPKLPIDVGDETEVNTARTTVLGIVYP